MLAIFPYSAVRKSSSHLECFEYSKMSSLSLELPSGVLNTFLCF